MLTVLAACGPETAVTESGSDTGGSSTGPASTGSTSIEPTTGAADSSGTSTGDLTTTGGSSTGDSTTGQVCLELELTDPRSFPPQPEFTCGLPELCPGDGPMVLTENNGGWTTPDVERARCMATALRDRTPGQLRFEIGGHLEFHTLEIFGEQAAVVLRQEGIGFGYSYAERVAFLRPPEFFGDCSVGTVTQIHACMIDAITDECVRTRDCPG